ncbi:MAG: hypothetical protein IJC15_09015, partial [Clostridia bacterium]|nr:hypothetical protein [Clostridia bacterium]
MDAIKKLIPALNTDLDGQVAAVGLSSQVGTYVINGRDVIGWYSDIGRDELRHIKSVISEEDFVREIAMPHPDLISYPLPRLLHIQKRFGPSCEVVMPKEIIVREFTAQTMTDVFSMRGIADPVKVSYADTLITRLGIDLKLPALKTPFDVAGYVTEQAAAEYGLPCDIPVYLGCNDFFAGLLGMGICDIGDAFDLSGTSEHVGYISDTINPFGCVSGPYFNGFCTYGGTKSSGASCKFAMETFGLDGVDMEAALQKDTPIFLP